jgi:predicted SprT family Zn-dependent metalloprotease
MEKNTQFTQALICEEGAASLYSYSEKSVALFFSSPPSEQAKEDMKSLFGRYNYSLTLNGEKKKGWIFSHKRREQLEKLINQWSKDVPQDEPVVETRVKKVEKDSTTTPTTCKIKQESSTKVELALKIAQELLEDNGLSDWSVTISKAKSYLGKCMHDRKQIVLSEVWIGLTDETRWRNTILHEISHALAPGHKHDSVWKAVANKIGCDDHACFKPTLELKGEIAKKYKYTISCACGANKLGKDSLRRDWSKMRCSKCEQFLTVKKNI